MEVQNNYAVEFSSSSNTLRIMSTIKPNVVIIGASYAGLHAATMAAKVPNVGSITVISPTPAAFFNIAAPQILINRSLLSSAIFDIKVKLQQNTNGKATLVTGLVTSVDLKNKTVNLTASTGGQALEYHTLIVASGCATAFSGFGVNTDSDLTQSSIISIADSLKSAKTVAVIGGGQYGVETAGEIAALSLNAKTTLYSLTTAPMIDVGLSSAATKSLTKLGVEIINNIKAVGDSGTGVVSLSTGESRNFDVVINCFVQGPNTGFLDQLVLDEAGYVKTTGVRIIGYEDSAIAIGDIVSGSPRTLLDFRFSQAPLLVASLAAMLSPNPSSGTNLFGKMPSYRPFKRIVAASVGPNGGVGKAFGIPIPGFVIRYARKNAILYAKQAFQ